MKSFCLIAFLILISALITAQDFFVPQSLDCSDETGQEFFQTQHFTPDEMFLTRDWEPFYWDDFDPGIAPEGDYLGAPVFSPFGTKVYLTNRMTDMLTVYNWSTMEVIANVPTGEWPSCIAATNSYIIVGCQFSDHVFIYDAQDYLLIDSIPTGEQPCKIHVSPDASFAYVGCDIDDVCTVIDLNSMTVSQTIINFPIYLQTVSWSTQSARNWAKYSDFLVSPDGYYLIVHNGESEVQLIDIATGTVSQTVNIISPRALAFSGDDDCLICASNPNGIANVHQISWPQFTLESTVEVTGYSLSTNEVVVDTSGAKAYIGTGSNTSTLIRFATSDFIQFSNTYTAFWLGVTPDHHYAIGGQYRFSIIDFENEVMTDQYQGKNQSWGAVSPVNNHVFGYDPLLYEGAHFFDISDPDNIEYRGSPLSGSIPEGDAPYRVAINSDYNYIITVNNLSYSCSIIDYISGDVVATFDLGESCYDVVTRNNFVVCGGYNNNTVKIIDLNNLELVAEVTTAQRPMELTLHPYLDIVYAANIKSNSISVIYIDGANSQLLTNIPCGIIGVYIPFFGIRSGVEVDPTGQYLLVAASFDDKVKIIDVETNEIVKSLDVGDFPLSIAFNSSDSIACVTNLFDHTFSYIHLDGENSEVIGTWSANGEYPVDVDYSYVDDEFWICTYYTDNISKFDARSGSLTGQLNMSTYGGVWSMEFYDDGNPVFLTAGSDTYDPAIIYKDSIFELPASASHLQLGSLDYNAFAAATIPGPDYVSLVKIDHLEQVRNLPLNHSTEINIFPNPFTDRLNISSEKVIKEIRMTDLTGRILLQEEVNGKSFTIDKVQVPQGIFLFEFRIGNGSVVVRKAISRY